MVREDRGIMSVQELWRVAVMRQTMEKPLPQVKARALVGLTPRYSQRLMEREVPTGTHGRAPRGRGTPSNQRIPEPVKATALRL